MPQILVRDLDEHVVERLKERARLEGRSLQAEAKAILEQATRCNVESTLKQIEDIQKMLKGRKFSDSAEIVREAREARVF